MTVFYCVRFETPLTWRARSPYLYPPGTMWPPTTRRATVEVFRIHGNTFLLPVPCIHGHVCLSHSDGLVSKDPYPRKRLFITCSLYPWTRLFITQRRAGFQGSVSTETPFYYLYPGSMDTSVYHTATDWFPRIRIHGNAFLLPVLCIHGHVCLSHSDGLVSKDPYPRKCIFITCTLYPWTRLFITQRRAGF
jgi:hypothetical protein